MSMPPKTADADGLVSFSGLTVRYGAQVALDAASGAVVRGATGLLGPNGAGKTTLLKTLLGFLRPASGTLNAFGLSPQEEPLEVRRRIGYVPEADAYLGEMTAVQNVSFAGELSGLPRGEAIRRAHEVLQFVGIGEERYRVLETYSTGMKQRAKLASALVHDPELVLLDEPTNGLDPEGREEMLALITDIVRLRGLSVVLCSHLLRDVERVCEHVLVISGGQIRTAGRVEDLKKLEREIFIVRVKGDSDAFVASVAGRGGEASAGADAWLVAIPRGAPPAWIFETAAAAGAQVRHLKRAEDTLEDIFIRATGAEAA
jgi:ABC-2 type transport system ATP-binding protein